MKPLRLVFVVGTLLFGAVVQGAQPPPAAPPPPLFFKQDWTWMRPANVTAQVPVVKAQQTTDDLEIKVYGAGAPELVISGDGSPTNPVNLFTGMTTSPIAVTVRDKRNLVDLTGQAKLRWLIRTSGFHAVRPVVKLADGTMLVGEHAVSSPANWQESDVPLAGMRWIRLDPARVVTRGPDGALGDAQAWAVNPDLSKVDEVGYVDLMPGSGHGAGGWANFSRLEVYGRPVRR